MCRNLDMAQKRKIETVSGAHGLEVFRSARGLTVFDSRQRLPNYITESIKLILNGQRLHSENNKA